MPTLSITKDFTWDILNLLVIQKDFTWANSITEVLYWFVVESYQTTDTCEGSCISMTLIASSVLDLAYRLTALKFNKRIKSVKKWSRPALECDVRKGEADGTSYECNVLEDVSFGIIQMYAFIKHGDFPGLDAAIGDPFVWYTEYGNLASFSVGGGATVIQGQEIGFVSSLTENNYNVLHFGVGDGQMSGNIGQTLSVDDFFHLETVGTRASGAGPGSTTFNVSQISYVMMHLIAPVDVNYCNWLQILGSPSHVSDEYYALDWSCSATVPVDTSAPRSTVGATVYCACGGPDILTTVDSVVGDTIVLKHSRYSAGLASIFSFMPRMISYYGEESYELLPLNPSNETVLTRISGVLPVALLMKHNMVSGNFAKFLHNNNYYVPEKLVLSYDKHADAWVFSKNYGKLIIRVEWKAEDKSWRFSLFINKGGKKTSVKANFKENMLKNGNFIANLKMKSIKDEIGVFEKSNFLYVEISL